MLDKGLKSVFLDLLLAVKSQHLFNLKLDRKTVSVPACLAWNHFTLHSAVARNHILDNTGQHMTDMRLAVGGRRSVVENIGLSLRAGVYTFFKNFIIVPEFFNFFLFFHEIQIRGNTFIHGNNSPFRIKGLRP